jgi:hypothetical protein
VLVVVVLQGTGRRWRRSDASPIMPARAAGAARAPARRAAGRRRHPRACDNPRDEVTKWASKKSVFFSKTKNRHFACFFAQT